MKKIKFLYSILSHYRKKLFKIFLFEIYYSIIYWRSGNFFKSQDNRSRTDTVPCPYYFIHKIAQFIKKKKIKNVVDLGCGFGRITNFLHDNADAKISGYEIDKEVFDIAYKNKKEGVDIKLDDILKLNPDDLNFECLILNDPFKEKNDLELLIKKIQSGKNTSDKTYFLITINIDKDKNYIFGSKKVLKTVSAGIGKNVTFYSN